MSQTSREPIRIVDYDAQWPVKFEEEKTQIVEALGDLVADVQHVGSTSVPGLAAKPIIDIMVAIKGESGMVRSITPLVKIGYVCLGEFGIPGRNYYRRNAEVAGLGLSHGGIARTHHLHTFPAGHAEWDRHIQFRDYLRSHPDAARDYETLKRDLASQFPADMDGYTDAKTEFIKAIEAKAMGSITPGPSSAADRSPVHGRGEEGV